MKRGFLIMFFMNCLFVGNAQQLSEKKEGNASNVKFGYEFVLGTYGSSVYSGTIDNGSLSLGMFDSETGRFERENTLKLYSSEEKLVPIENVYLTEKGIVLIGKQTSSSGYDYYIGVAGEGEEFKVTGKKFHSVLFKKNNPVQYMKVQLAKEQDRICLSYFDNQNKEKPANVHVIVAKLNGELIQESEIRYWVGDFEEGAPMFNVFLGDFDGFIAVYNELDNAEEPESGQTKFSWINLKGKYDDQQNIGNSGILYVNCNISRGLENTVVISGFVYNQGYQKDGFEEITMYKYSLSDKKFENEITVPAANIESSRFPILGLYELKLNPIEGSFIIKGVTMLSSGNIVLYAENIRLYRTSTDIVFVNDVLLINSDPDGNVNWANLIPARQNVASVDKFDFGKEERRLNSFWATQFIVSEEGINLLYKRPNFDNRLELIPENNFVPVWLYLESEDGVGGRPEFMREKESNSELMYLNKYYEFSN